jgi:hypothetical protein
MPAIPYKPFNREYAGVTKMVYRVKWATRRSDNVRTINENLRKGDPNHPVKLAHLLCIKDGLAVEGTKYKGGKRVKTFICPSIYMKSYLKGAMKYKIPKVVTTEVDETADLKNKAAAISAELESAIKQGAKATAATK